MKNIAYLLSLAIYHENEKFRQIEGCECGNTSHLFRNEQFTRQIKYAWNEGDEDREIVGTQGVED